MTVKMFSFRVEEEMRKYLKIKAAMESTSVQQLVNKILTEWIEEQEKEGK